MRQVLQDLSPDMPSYLSHKERNIFEVKMYRGTSVEETIKRLKDTPLSNTSAFRKNNIFCTPGKLDFFAHHGPSFFTSVIPWLRHILEHEIN